MKKSEIIRASLIAPLAVLLLPVILSVVTVVKPYLVGIDSGDDAPVRAAGMMLFALIPILYIVTAVAMAFLAFVLSSMQRLTLRNLFFLAGFVSIIVGLLFGLPSPFGLRDQLVGLLIFSTLTMLCLSLGVVAWWRLAAIGDARSPNPES